PFSQAQALLHVSATPEFLPCREKQREEISGILGDGIISGSGTCLYIHGVPGTGKTATVHSVVRELQKDPDIPPFQFLEINGMKIAEPSTAFSILWEAVSGGKKAASPRVALGELERWFAEPRVGRGTTVVLVDELDQMITKKQDVVYNFFNWPHMPHSKLIVIAVANTMDLPERELSGKIRSRLGSNRLVFTPYKWDELSTIILSRLDQGGKGLKDKVFATKAVEVIAKKVAAGAGDARRALDVARCVARWRSSFEGFLSFWRRRRRSSAPSRADPTPPRSTEHRRTVEKVSQLPPPTRLCTISDASATYREMTDYGSNAFLKGLSLQEKVLMLSLGQVVRRRGVGEVEVDEVCFLFCSLLLPFLGSFSRPRAEPS
ncbi:P-loop containing nucleoside triphosphate hydrolase protein, partial [Leucosporidium creatinivorum]